uniref:Defensin-like protein n=1 Tax=Panagrellus redivivus TaxID=6233 RepID=A0A7E4UVS5_PANRE
MKLVLIVCSAFIVFTLLDVISGASITECVKQRTKFINTACKTGGDDKACFNILTAREYSHIRHPTPAIALDVCRQNLQDDEIRSQICCNDSLCKLRCN